MKASKMLVLALFIAVLAVICFLTFRESSHLVEVSWMPERWGLWLDQHSKFRHFVGFMLLGGLAFSMNFDAALSRSHSRAIRRLRSSRYRTGRLGALFVLIYLLELGQLMMPRREFDWLDIVNGWGGVLFAWSLWFALKSQQRRRRRAPYDRRHEPINVSTVRFR